MGALTEAVSWHRKALTLAPKFTSAMNNLAIVYKDMGNLAESHSIYKQLVARDPDDATIHSNLLMGLHYREAEDGEAILKAHRNWAAQHEVAEIRFFTNPPHQDRRLRIGYVSPDFWTHSVANFVTAPLRHHDRAAFHVSCYSDVLKPDDTTRKLRALADVWRDVRVMDDRALAERVIADEIDILIDLAGHTADNRLKMFGRRVAPIQMTWVGYPATSGLKQMDYRVSDSMADPPGDDASGGTDHLCSEKILRLAGCFLCYTPPNGMADIELPINKTPPSQVTFGSFNNFSKVTDEMIFLWAAILRRVPNSKLLLKSRQIADSVVQKNLIQVFADQGVSQERLVFKGRVDGRGNHLALYNDMDIALDTFPYNGTTTSCEALLMGVPVITRRGSLHAGRVGASLLNTIGRAEWIAGDDEEYVGIAVSLAANLPNKGAVRQDLLRSALTDGTAFTRTLEKAYRSAWRVWCADRAK